MIILLIDGHGTEDCQTYHSDRPGKKESAGAALRLAGHHHVAGRAPADPRLPAPAWRQLWQRHGHRQPQGAYARISAEAAPLQTAYACPPPISSALRKASGTVAQTFFLPSLSVRPILRILRSTRPLGSEISTWTR